MGCASLIFSFPFKCAVIIKQTPSLSKEIPFDYKNHSEPKTFNQTSAQKKHRKLLEDTMNMKSNSTILKVASDAINFVIYRVSDARAKAHLFNNIMTT